MQNYATTLYIMKENIIREGQQTVLSKSSNVVWKT